MSPLRPIGRVAPALVFGAAVLLGGAAGFLSGSGTVAPRERTMTVRARQYAYEPAVIRVNKGDTLRLRLVSDDVVHGFYLEGHDIDALIRPLNSKVELRHPSRPAQVEEVEEVVFTARQEGKFRYRCSHTCGFLHPFMLGELIVEPNRLLPTSMGMAVGLLLGGLVCVWRRGGRS